MLTLKDISSEGERLSPSVHGCVELDHKACFFPPPAWPRPPLSTRFFTASFLFYTHTTWQTAALKIGEAIYGNKGAAGGDAEGAEGGAEGAEADKENVQDAEFSEKKEGGEKEKKSQ